MTTPGSRLLIALGAVAASGLMAGAAFAAYRSPGMALAYIHMLPGCL
ncbi:hypothetical protein [Thioalkalivibrio thiocyanodenitrificans]|nr:hypothetical protein [Thioalkalivibrio thiocyanodenitrificans]